MNNRKYENPPVVESLCDFDFDIDGELDANIPGLFYNAVGSKYPIKKNPLIVSVELNHDYTSAKSTKGNITQFWSEDEKSLLQVDLNKLIVNKLSPYGNWDAFQFVILENLKAYLPIAKAKKIKTITLRYINVIEIPLLNKAEDSQDYKEKIDLHDYVNWFPSFSEEFPPMSGVNLQIEFPYKEQNCTLIIHTGNIYEPRKDVFSFLLDLSCISTTSMEANEIVVRDWLNGAHTTIATAFENLITDRCREIFNNPKK